MPLFQVVAFKRCVKQNQGEKDEKINGIGCSSGFGGRLCNDRCGG
jgi:hypothetical protein